MSLIGEFQANNRKLSTLAARAITDAERERGPHCDPAYIFMAITAMPDTSVASALVNDNSLSSDRLVQALLVKDVSAFINDQSKAAAPLSEQVRLVALDRMVASTELTAALRRHGSITLSDLMVGVVMSDSFIMKRLLHEIGCDKYELAEALGGTTKQQLVENHL
jgi:hypothetical protein